MIEAHGGFKKWENAPTVSYDNLFFNPSTPKEQDPWWVTHEIIDQRTKNVFQFWPIYNSKLVFDGQNTWTANWSIGNHPKFMVHFFYYFLNLPWLTQDKNVSLSEKGTGKLPGLEKDYLIVEMTFKEVPTVGKTQKDKFILYIDPQTYILQGYHYYISYGSMMDLMGLPANLETMGPVVRVFQNFTSVDGLLMPTRFYSTNPNGDPIYGHHVIINYSFKKEFENDWLIMPSDAKIDKSSPNRKSK